MTVPFLLLVILGAVLISVAVRRLRVQAGLVIVVVAAAMSFIPGLPRLEVDPEIILGIVMPPLLYSAALHFSTSRFKQSMRPILMLGVVLVLVTAFAVAGVVSWLVPGIGGAALVLAAVVSPPDTVTTVTKGAEIGLPRRLVDILTGESLINDATALVLFSVAVTGVTGAHELIESPVLYFGYAVVVGIVIGFLIGSVALVVRAFARQPALEVVVSLLVPFAAFLTAEAVEASGVLAVVTAGFAVASRAYLEVPGRSAPTSYLTRIQEKQVWPIVDLLLEAFVFAYIGLQFRFVIEDLIAAEISIWPPIGVALVVLLTVVVVRFAWVYLVFGWWSLTARLFRRKLATDPEFASAARARAEERAARETARRSEQLRRRWQRRFGDDPQAKARFERINERLVAAGRPARRAPLDLGWKENFLVSWTGMRGIVTLAAAGGVPYFTLAGDPFPGRPFIQLAAFVVAIGTLVIQGLSLPWIARRLAIDTSADDAEAAAAHAEANAVSGLRDRPLDELTARDFVVGRSRVSTALQFHEVDEDAARAVIDELDLQQAAARTRQAALHEGDPDDQDETPAPGRSGAAGPATD